MKEYGPQSLKYLLHGPLQKNLLTLGLNHLGNVAFPKIDQRTIFQEVVLWVQFLYNTDGGTTNQLKLSLWVCGSLPSPHLASPRLPSVPLPSPPLSTLKAEYPPLTCCAAAVGEDFCFSEMRSGRLSPVAQVNQFFVVRYSKIKLSYRESCMITGSLSFIY